MNDVVGGGGGCVRGPTHPLVGWPCAACGFGQTLPSIERTLDEVLARVKAAQSAVDVEVRKVAADVRNLR
jgi:hypothetical protein